MATTANMGFGYTAGGRNLCFWRQCMIGQQSRRDKQRSAFGYVVGHLYFYGQKVWPGGTSYECPGIAKPFTLAVIFSNTVYDLTSRIILTKNHD
jgi:hypothetical protein